MRWIVFSWLALALVAAVYGEEKKVAIVEAKEASELVAEHRQLDIEDDDEDQLALESVHHLAEDKDGDHYHDHDHHEQAVAYAAPPPAAPAYAAPPPAAPAYAPPAPAYGPRQPLPVPIPVPVKPGALVLPSLPVKPVKYPAPQPVQRPYGQAAPSYAPPAPVAQPPPPAYSAPAPAPAAYQPPPPAPAPYAPPAAPAYAAPAPAYAAPAPAYVAPAPAPAYQPPAPVPQYKQPTAPAYQAPPPAPQPLPQPAAYQAPPPAGGPYQVPSAAQPVQYQAPVPAPPPAAPYQAAPEAAPAQPAYQAQPQPAPYQAQPQPQPAPYQGAPVEQPAPEAQAYQGAPHEAPAEQGGSYIGQRNIDPQEYQAAAEQLQDTAPAAAVPIPTAEAWPSQPVNEMPKIVAIDVKCEKSLMKVAIQFDKPFYGIIFSKNHYANPNCVHLPAGLGRSSANFDVSINACGTVGNTENGLYGYGVQSGSGTFFENTIIIQYDPQVQEVWDQARKLRCTWHDQYEKSVTFRPFPVDMLDVVRADFAGDNVGCWMQIQVGKGPWASEVSGLVKIGQTMTMVLAIKDDENKFDMLVRNCMAHDGKRAPIQLVDQRGCVTRPKLMSRFTKIKNFGASASVLSYAHFQAFKFPDSMEVHFQCTIQICRYQCPDQCADDAVPALPDPRIPASQYSERMGTPREDKTVRTRRDVSEKQDVGINKIIQVVSTGDLTFALEQTKDNTTTIVIPSRSELDGLVCMTSPGFAATLVILLAILVISCLLSAFLCMRHRSYGGDRSLMTSYDNPSYVHTSLKKSGFF